MGARTALVALLSALSLPGVRPSPSALGLGTSRRLAPMAQAVRALPADYKWDVLVNTAVYGETPKTFTKRKQVEFLEALQSSRQLRRYQKVYEDANKVFCDNIKPILQRHQN